MFSQAVDVVPNDIQMDDNVFSLSGAQYVRCRAQRCTEANRQYLFPGYVDTNSLVVQDEYVFTQVCGEMLLYYKLYSTMEDLAHLI